MSKVLILGATGRIGSELVREAVRRGHQVTAAARDVARAPALDGVAWLALDAGDAEAVERAAGGHDAVLASISGRRGGHEAVPALARGLLGALARAGVPRLLWVGGAGSLEAAPGVRVIDSPGFPEAWKAEAQAQIAALEVFRDIGPAAVDWTFFSPAALIEPGERTGRYRVGGDQLLVDAEGRSRISISDFAVALLDELESGGHPGQRVTIAY